MGLNLRFLDAIRDLVGEDAYDKLRKTKGFLLAQRVFEREIKKAFGGKDEEEYFVNFPMADLDDDPEAGLESNTWRMTG